MRSLLCLCLLVVGVAAFRPEPAKPKAMLAVVAFDSATVKLQASVKVNGNLRPGDAIRFNWFKDGTLVTSKDTTVNLYDMVLPSPACGTSATYYFVSRMVYNGVADSKTVKSNVLPYTAAGCPVPPPTIDSATVRVSPTSVSVVPGGSVQFQASTNSGQPITWRVVGAGTVSSTGLYTAPL